jgi:hypothetical protein
LQIIGANLSRLRQNGPSVAEMMDVLGMERTIERLEEADNTCHVWIPRYSKQQTTE